MLKMNKVMAIISITIMILLVGCQDKPTYQPQPSQPSGGGCGVSAPSNIPPLDYSDLNYQTIENKAL